MQKSMLTCTLSHLISPRSREWKKDRLHRLLLTTRKWNPSAAEWTAMVVNTGPGLWPTPSDSLHRLSPILWCLPLSSEQSYFIASKFYVLMKVIPILINMMFPAKLTDIQKTADSWLPIIWCTCLSVRRAKISTWNWKLSKFASDQGTFTCQIFKEKQFKKYLLVLFNFQSSFIHIMWTSQLPQDAAGQVSSSPCHRRSIKEQELTENNDSRTELLEHFQVYKDGNSCSSSTRNNNAVFYEKKTIG